MPSTTRVPADRIGPRRAWWIGNLLAASLHLCWPLVGGFGASSGVLNTRPVLLNVVIPLWLVEETDVPWVLLAWLFGTNTVMCVFLLAWLGHVTVPLAEPLPAPASSALQAERFLTRHRIVIA